MRIREASHRYGAFALCWAPHSALFVDSHMRNTASRVWYIINSCYFLLLRGFFFFFSFQSTTGSKIFFLSFMSRVEAAQNLLKEPRVSPGVCFWLYPTIFLFSKSEPKDPVGEKFKSDRWESAIFICPAVRLRTFATRSEKSSVPGSNYKAVSRANFLLNCVLHS